MWLFSSGEGFGWVGIRCIRYIVSHYLWNVTISECYSREGRQEGLRLALLKSRPQTSFRKHLVPVPFSLICFNLKPKFYCYILSCCPRVPSITVLTRRPPCVPVVDIQRKGPDGCFLRSRCRMQSQWWTCACRRTAVFTDQMDRQAYFRLLTPSPHTSPLASSTSARIWSNQKSSVGTVVLSI